MKKVDVNYTLVLPNGDTQSVSEEYLKDLYDELHERFGTKLHFPLSTRGGGGDGSAFPFGDTKIGNDKVFMEN